MDIRTLQKPLKEQYRSDPSSSKITIRAKGAQTGAPIACSVDIGWAIHQAEAHKGVGGAGAGACSGDLLLGALAACAQRVAGENGTVLRGDADAATSAAAGDGVGSARLSGWP
jgi:hypothetical protein